MEAGVQGAEPTTRIVCTWRFLTSHADLVTHPPATSLLLDARHQRLGKLCEICCNVQRPRETDRRTAKLEFLNNQREDRDVQEFLDLFLEDSQRNIHAGDREVRPRHAPTTEAKERVAAVSSWPPFNRANDSSAMSTGWLCGVLVRVEIGVMLALRAESEMFRRFKSGACNQRYVQLWSGAA